MIRSGGMCNQKRRTLQSPNISEIYFARPELIMHDAPVSRSGIIAKRELNEARARLYD